jgi:hypothetical protein
MGDGERGPGQRRVRRRSAGAEGGRVDAASGVDAEQHREAAGGHPGQVGGQWAEQRASLGAGELPAGAFDPRVGAEVADGLRRAGGAGGLGAGVVVHVVS